MHAFRPAYDCSAWWRQATFSSGKRIDPEVVSISMPRNIRRVVGPSNFSIARGTPSSSKAWKMMSRLRPHTCEPGGPMVIRIVQIDVNLFYAPLPVSQEIRSGPIPILADLIRPRINFTSGFDPSPRKRSVFVASLLSRKITSCRDDV